ncbi:Crp/Fnr family transcriptional regulator [Chitinophaga ginsengisegetis]|uniref:Crp/Fnr family transcriptional regulator n=1 Tax=Chitinophaga ginsengisegetis TaxID=393003 RepID=UPI000DBF9320|nr:Crp/Fnr family transcriptional regulator [Chitinophaga ginsengisegetis]MDR6565612.1 CRP-like cAMP-binding protein [Chitinophaga ginsengisegetis]MDR6645341.1 CRP-like cAMP-binding protein [Chitinophaga ginsengisegetis]MDR6652068.1 CRP-like cAMP-binding protein [Chitinophaga ginsengisegetis]
MSIHTNLINSIGHFIRMDEAEQSFVSSLFVSREYQKNDYFLREGQVCREAGFIEKGLIRYHSIKDSGEDVTLDFGKENEFTCNYESFLDHSPSQRSIQCIEPTEILAISYENLQLIYSKVKEGEKFGRLICEYLYLQAIKKVSSFYGDQPEQRYLHFINSYPDLQQRIPQYYISSFVGVKPPSLSRIRKRLSM